MFNRIFLCALGHNDGVFIEETSSSTVLFFLVERPCPFLL